MILILLLLCVAAAALLPHVLLRKFGYKNLTYTLAFSETEVSEGDTVTLTETICSRKPLPLPWVKAHDRCVSDICRRHIRRGDGRNTLPFELFQPDALPADRAAPHGDLHTARDL